MRKVVIRTPQAAAISASFRPPASAAASRPSAGDSPNKREAALMLCEALLHLLVEEGVITQETAMTAIWRAAGAIAASASSVPDDPTQTGSAILLVRQVSRRLAANFPASPRSRGGPR